MGNGKRSGSGGKFKLTLCSCHVNVSEHLSWKSKALLGIETVKVTYVLYLL